MNNFLKLIASIALCQFAGFLGSVFTVPKIRTFYASLHKPAFTPPDWLFGPVWTTLYLLMGISLFLVWKRGLGQPLARWAVLVFVAQLVLNVLWSVLFFALESPGLGLIDLGALWILILATGWLFSRLSTAAGVLFIPYLLWVGFAGALNLSIWRLNG